MKFDYLLRLLDRYPMRVEGKGTSRQMLSKKIIITSIFSPEETYDQYFRYNNDRVGTISGKSPFSSADEISVEIP